MFRALCSGDIACDGAVPAQRHRAAMRGGLPLRGQARLLQPHTQGARQMCRIHEEVSFEQDWKKLGKIK